MKIWKNACISTKNWHCHVASLLSHGNRCDLCEFNSFLSALFSSHLQSSQATPITPDI